MEIQRDDTSQKLGTFPGVFTPSILTILGIILFLRLGYVVGSAGVMYALLIIAVANVISILTSFSLAAIATNLKVKGGGDYYLISRTLGLEYGGALGLVLFLAQSVSIAFYCIGFGEVVASFFPGSSVYLPQLIAGIAVVMLFLLAYKGADLATRFQYVVMIFMTLALLSFYLGGVTHWDSAQLAVNWKRPENTEPFWVLFAIFFPAVTGFTQGVSMSGDLKDPGKSLPTGTFLAVGLSVLVYISVAIFLGAARPLQILSSDYSVMGEISRWDFFISAGVIAATLSSAMASFLGAPRILQSLAKDKIFSILNPFAIGEGPNDNPRRGVLLSAAIAFLTIAVGQLDLVARLVSMFFLISYGLLNYATYYEARAASPSFRPRFRWYHPAVSLAGFLACLVVMLAIDLRSGLVAVALLFAVYQYLVRVARPARWADSQRSHYLQRVRTNLFAAGTDPDHPRDWRPYIIALSDNSSRRQRLLEYAALIEGGSGITTVVKFLQGEGAAVRRQRKEAAEDLEKEVQQHRKDVFSRVISGSDPERTLEALIQSFGLGPIQANTLLFNWIDADGKDPQIRALRFGKYLHIGHSMGCHIIVLSAADDEWQELRDKPKERKQIDIWWRGDATSKLMLLLAYLVTRDQEWSDSLIRVIAVNYQAASKENILLLQETLEETRIHAESVIEVGANLSTMVDKSADSTLVFMPLDLKNSEPVDIFGNPVEDAVSRLGVTALVLAGQPVDLDAEPEDGEAGELGLALDALEKANSRTEIARKKSEEAAEHAKRLMDEIELGGGLLDDVLAQKLKSAMRAREKADKSERKVLREEAKTKDAEKRVESYESLPDEKDSNPESSLL